MRWIIIFVLTLGCIGCSRTDYHVQMKRTDKGVQRTTVVNKAAGGGGAQAPDEKLFDAVFEGKTPDDIGGAGAVQRWSSPLGSVTLYSERFRGDDDLVKQIETLSAAADRFVEVLIGWWGHELKADENWPKLKAFLDEQFRRDLKNAGLYAWQSRAVGSDEADATLIVRVGQYLAEREYFEWADVPRLSREISDDGPKLLQRLVADRMVGRDKPVPASLAFLGNERDMKNSLEAWYRTTPEFAASGDESPNVDAVIFSPLQTLGLEIFPQTEQVNVTFAADAEPGWTNGTWDVEKKAVTWSQRMNGPVKPPAFAWAVWAEADAAVQQRRLGKVAYEGNELAQFVMWYAGLEGEAKQRADALIESLGGEPDAQAKLEALRQR